MPLIAAKDVRLKYALYGAAFGLCFPIIATLFDVFIRDLEFSIQGLLEAQKTQPLHWIIDTAPLFLGIFSCLAGIKQQEVINVNAGLEEKVAQRTQMLNEQNGELRVIQDELEDSLTRISQSIDYAQRIQDAIISNTQEMKNAFSDSMIMFKPRDVVSGDFPWYIKKDGYHFIAAVDCTGHGVPGAFMSLIGFFLLNKIVKDEGILETNEILCALHLEVVKVLNQGTDSDVHDGMDLALCRIDEAKGEVMFSGAGNPVYHVRGEDLIEYKPDFWSIGGTQYKKRKPYTSKTFEYKKGDILTVFSDGVTDQFSADGSTKFGYRPIKKALTQNFDSTFPEIQSELENKLTNWMGDYRQMDDMLLISVRL